MQPLFISYRRSDSEAYTGRLYDRLVVQFGKDAIFKDVDSIPLGIDFRSHLSAVVSQCRAVLAVVGPHWLEARDESGARRLDNRDDFVRIELEAALAREVPLIPVLVSGAVMPTAPQLPESLADFAFRQGTAVRPDPDFHRDVDRLLAFLQPLVGGSAVIPAGAPAAQRSNLPRNLPGCIGRTDLVAGVVADLNNHPVVTLAGFGGIGKTRIAQQVGLELAAQLPHGVWFVDLAGLAAEGEVLATVARTLGVREHTSESLAVTLTEALRERELLIILDNCERLLQGIAALVEQVAAAAPNVRILATSREPLGVYGEKIVRVAGLDETAAVALFEARAAQIRTDMSFDRAVLAQLCRRLDFVPLAIELAAAHVRSLAPAQILARVSERVGVLRATDRRAARHQTLEALVAWSYDLLTAPERTLLNRLSVFVGSFDLAAAEQVSAGAGIDAQAVVELLDRLVDKSLLSAGAARGATRFRLMDTVRQYAAGKLEAAGEQAEMFDRHARHFSRQAQALGERIRDRDTRDSSAALLSDIDNLNAALDRLAGQGQHTEKAGVVVALNLFWQMNAPGTGRRRYEELVTVEAQLAPEMRFLTLLEAASFFSNLGFATRAVPLLERARAAAQAHALDLPPYFYYVAAQVAEMDGRAADALSLCAAGTAVLQPEDDFNALSLRSRALTSILKLQPALALEHARATLRSAQETGMDLFVSVAHMLIGLTLMLQGRLEESQPELLRAIELADQAMPQVTISALVALAAGYRAVDPARSIARAREALEVEARSDIMPWFRVIAAYLLAWQWAAAERAEDGARLLGAMDEMRRRCGFAGIWWGQEIRDEARERLCGALSAARVQELAGQGSALTVSEVRQLLAAP
ncbi:MAG: TIR domain-containing protein [Proteobacteria bacterium]|nr:TIR domain-containing protein [Pseudomonadota bacterium]